MAKKILIVEDNESLCRIMADTFSDEGFEVQTANDGEAGLAAALKWQPDLILLDILMPKLDGKEMLERLRAEPGGEKTKVIILTNSGSGQQVLEFMNLGVTDYLTKADWELSNLVEKVKQRLKE